MRAEQFAEAQKLLLQRDVNSAIKCFDSAQMLGYPITDCAAGRWTCWMLLGEFERAWQESDLISASEHSNTSQQLWNGESWDGKRVMLRCLHGLGDTIQFVRYVPLLKNTCRFLAVQTHPELVSLIRGVPGVDLVFTWDGGVSEDPVEWDVQLEVTELPRAFRTQRDGVPAQIPYIDVPPARIQWASTFFPSGDSFRVGIIWQAGPFDASRSVRLSQLSYLFSNIACRFYSLQKGCENEAKAYPSLLDLATHAGSVQDTAALMLNMDLIITVDTMTAHLAGALGRPVWIMLPFKADWRWMLNRTDTPWYPSARLFRQSPTANWESVVESLVCALAERVRTFENLAERVRFELTDGFHRRRFSRPH